MKKQRKIIHLSDLARGIILGFVALLSITTLVIAEYTGPNRTYTYYTTSYQRKQCHYTGVKDYPGIGYCACSYTKYVSTSSGCPGIDTGLFSNSACGWTGICASYGLTGTSSSSSIQSCSASDTGATVVQTPHTTSYPSATASGTVSCATPGENGWCVSADQISISGTEPLSGYSIAKIEGAVNGVAFSCSGATCQQPLVEGTNTYTYWADSTYGDTSLKGSTSTKQDTQKPQVEITQSGTVGNNGWYTAITISGSAIDPTPGSGIDTFVYSLDGGANQSYTAPLVMAAGSHNVAMTAKDVAGWTDTKTQTVDVDLNDPTITDSVDGTVGKNSWFTTAATLIGSAADPAPGSGLDTFMISENGGPFTAFTGRSLLTDGTHDVILRAEDFAGRVTTDEKTIAVDTQKPVIITNITGQAGLNGWFINATFNAGSNDPTPGSGIASIEYSLDGAGWLTFPGSLPLADGEHTVVIRTADQAGWTNELTASIKADSGKPTLLADISGTTSDGITYTSDAVITASGADSLSGLSRIEYNDNNGAWITYTKPLSYAIGQHHVTLRSVDNAGNISDEKEFSFSVYKKGPYIEMPTRWNLFESPNAVVNAGDAVLSGAIVTISDPQNRYPSVVRNYSFSGSSYSISLSWDRKYSDGTTAPVGEVSVSVDAWDALGLHATSSGMIEIELGPTVTPTNTPLPIITNTPVAAVVVPAATNTPLPPTPQPKSVVAADTVSRQRTPQNNLKTGLSYATLLTFLGMITFSVAGDKRPPEIDKLNKQIEIHTKNISK